MVPECFLSSTHSINVCWLILSNLNLFLRSATSLNVSISLELSGLIKEALDLETQFWRSEAWDRAPRCSGARPPSLPMGLRGGSWEWKSGFEKEWWRESMGEGYFTIVGSELNGTEEIFLVKIDECFRRFFLILGQIS